MPRAIEQGLDGARRVAKIVRAMKEFSHPDSADKTATDLNRAIESTITVARNEWKYVAEIATEFDETLPPVVCYPGDINQVILNLLVNAAHAIKEKVKDGEKGQITVCTRQARRIRGNFRDRTAAREFLKRSEQNFRPFFTTKEVGKGTGQGLAWPIPSIVKKHRGKIWFETEAGSRHHILRSTCHIEVRSIHKGELMPKRLLFVDDEPMILNGSGEPCTACVGSGRWNSSTVLPPRCSALIEALRRHRHGYAHARDGWRTSCWNRSSGAIRRVIRMVLSGQSSRGGGFRSIAPAHQFLSKPCDPQELVARLDAGDSPCAICSRISL